MKKGLFRLGIVAFAGLALAACSGSSDSSNSVEKPLPSLTTRQTGKEMANGMST